MTMRRWYIAALVIVSLMVGYAVVDRLLTPAPPRFDQPVQSPTYSYSPGSSGKDVPGAEAGFIHATKHGDSTSLAVWGNLPAASGGRRNVTPGYTSGRVADREGRSIFQWEARLKNQFEGVLSIDDKGYRLSAGKLFLVAFDAGPVRILQLDRDLAGMMPPEIRERFAEDPDVIRFFRESAGPKAEQSHALDPAAGPDSEGKASPPAQ